MSHFRLLFIVFFIPALACRLWVISSQTLAFAVGDFLGISYDILFTTLLIYLLSFVPEYYFRIVLVPVYVIYILCLRISYEYAKVFGGFPNIRRIDYLFDATFFNASNSAIVESYYLNIVLLLPLAFILSAWTHAVWRKQRKLNLIVLIFSVLLILTLPVQQIFPWRRSNPFIKNLRYYTSFEKKYWNQKNVSTSNKLDLIKGVLKQDLSGSTRLTTDKRAQNLLLIIVEGLSGYSATEATNTLDRYLYLNRFSEFIPEAFHYKHFVSLQRQTHRGTYSLLCGDFPNLKGGMPRVYQIESYMSKMKFDCLPQLLANQGFQTSYLQSAPLSFMRKDKFLALMGFQEVKDSNSFKSKVNHRGYWGVDDYSLFRAAVRKIEVFQESEQPWFLSLLTVGTHHPYTVPGKFMGMSPGGSLADAFKYLDLALTDFFKALKKLQVLENTLVVITGDESVGSLVGSKKFDQQWGALLVFEPYSSGAEISETFTQADLSISMLDYFNIGYTSPLPIGRSIFRTYPTSRPIVFANETTQEVGLFDTSKTLTLCNESFQTCKALVYDSNHFLWQTAYEQEAADRSAIEALHTLSNTYPTDYMDAVHE